MKNLNKTTTFKTTNLPTNIQANYNSIQIINGTKKNCSADEFQDAYTQIYNELQDRMLNSITHNYFRGVSHMAEDAFQESITKLFEKIEDGSYDNPWGIYNWIKRACRYEAMAAFNYKKEQQKQAMKEITFTDFEQDNEEYIAYLSAVSEQLNNNESIHALSNRREINRVIKQAVLNSDQRKILKMATFEQMKIKEIAEEMDMNENTVKSNLRYARMALNKWKKGNHYDPREHLYFD